MLNNYTYLDDAKMPTYILEYMVQDFSTLIFQQYFLKYLK